MHRQRSRSVGFTLIELVAVMLVLGILSVGVTDYVRRSVEAYQSVQTRTGLVNGGRFAVERLTRELRNALPGSVRVDNNASTQCLEFVPVEVGAIYRDNDLPVGAANDRFQAADFSYPSSALSDKFIAVYTTSSDLVYDASLAARSPLASVAVTDADNFRLVQLAANHQFPAGSPTRRFYLVGLPVSFCLASGQLSRYSGYAYSSNQALPPASGGALLAQSLDSGVSAFEFLPGTLTRTAIVKLDLRFVATDEAVRFAQEIHLRNVF